MRGAYDAGPEVNAPNLPKRRDPMSDDIDRTDEYLELEAEEARRDKAITNGQHPDDPGPEPPPDEPHPDAPEPDAADSDDGWYVEDGARLLERSSRGPHQVYVVFVDEDQAIAVTLWIAATHGIPAWQHATRLIIAGPSETVRQITAHGYRCRAYFFITCMCAGRHHGGHLPLHWQGRQPDSRPAWSTRPMRCGGPRRNAEEQRRLAGTVQRRVAAQPASETLRRPAADPHRLQHVRYGPSFAAIGAPT